MSELSGPTLSDLKGVKRIRKLKERIAHVDEQIAELHDKKEIMQHEIREIEKGLRSA